MNKILNKYYCVSYCENRSRDNTCVFTCCNTLNSIHCTTSNTTVVHSTEPKKDRYNNSCYGYLK